MGAYLFATNMQKYVFYEDQFLRNTNITKAGLQRLANMTSVLSNDPESTMIQILGAMAVAYE